MTHLIAPPIISTIFRIKLFPKKLFLSNFSAVTLSLRGALSPLMPYETLRGLGKPRWTMHRSVSPDYSRVIDFMKLLEAKYEYNFEKAKTQIYEGLMEAGAILKEGKWYYGEKPITINFLIRPEDERKDVGDYVSDQLERLGFTVNRLYKPSRDAFLLWGAFAPTKRGEWHIYTAGWANTAIVAYSDDDPWFFYSPDNAPLFEEYTGPPLLREAIDKLNGAQYGSMEERNELVRRINELALADGVHIWLYDAVQAFPMSSNLGPLAYDLYGGIWSLWSFRTIRYGTGPGGEIKLGNRAMFIEGFNGIGGFSWLYDVFAPYLVADVGVWPHPHTGRYIPVRANFEVNTAGPDGKFSVPEDALKYDVETKSWQTVGTGVKATSKVTVDFVLGKFHHGQAMTKADLLYTIAEIYQIVTPGTELYDPIAASPSRTLFVNNLRGFKILSDDKVEFYLDYWHVDESFIAYQAIGPSFTDTPWELLAIMNKVVASKESAWSIDMADILGVEMLDLTKGPTLELLKAAYDELSAENYVPPELAGIVTPEEARARWDALGNWYASKQHFWVSNGPYMFGKADTTALQMTFEAFREYPYRADHWDDLLTVKSPEVKVTMAPVEVVPGLPATFEVTTTVAEQPYDRVAIKYLVRDPKGALITKGVGTRKAEGKFSIILSGNETANFATGAYTIDVIGVGEESALPSFTSATFTVIPALAYFERLLKGTSAELNTKINELTATLASANAKVTALETTVSGLQSMLTTAIAVAVVSLIVAIVAIVMALKK
ncbi:hypothetical protein KEJ19_07780 [Candidatus Bathyarchaeota archaeon]|nr:hypothetical protein [Candidatus Bathyarchaeota archaeon]